MTGRVLRHALWTVAALVALAAIHDGPSWRRVLGIVVIAAWLTWVVTAARSASSSAPEPELTEPGGWSVELTDTGDREINVIKAIRACTGADLVVAKERTHAVPSLVVTGLSRDSGELVRRRLVDAGATASVVPDVE